ncbi:MAG: pilus assembly protein PilP [Hylemonella sp.]|jgi:type IV pilus assembly protein PilP
MSEDEKLKGWIAEQRQQIRPRVNPLPVPKPFQPEPYEAAALPDPFGKEKLNMVLRRSAAQLQADPLLSQELRRRKEPLEEYPLDAMTMVGSLSREGEPMALIRADKLLYQVRVGNYLGKNYGRVTKITETELMLREIVQDAAGEWVERPSSLQLQEKTK